jgi:hypothetical protein
MKESEVETLQSINEMLQHPDIAGRIDEIADRVERNFQTASESLAWETVPLKIYRNRLPPAIRSSWVFLLKEGCSSGAERHPNSHQRVRAWRGKGDLQIRIHDVWESNILEPRFDIPLEQQWASIPVGVWHQAVTDPGAHWIVVSFHTANETELIEERPESGLHGKMNQRLYVP